MVAVLLAGLGAGRQFLKATFSYSSVCPICCEVQETIEWQFPFTEITYYTSASTHATDLSRVIAARRPPGTHEHQWRFSMGSGNGVRCALGDGQELWHQCHNAYTSRFVDGVLAYGDAALIDEVLATFTNRDAARQLDIAAGMSQFPDNGVQNASEFRQWWGAHRKDWSEFWKNQL